MNDPRTLTLFTVVFILLGIFNVFSGLRRMREARARGQQIAWYRQINILTGLEFILLSLLFLMSLNSSAFPSSVKPIAGIFYLVLLLLAAVLAGLVIRQAITNTRTLRKNQSSQALRNGTISAVNTQIAASEAQSNAAIEAATKAYRLAWCDGPPFAYHWGLEKAKQHLKELGAPEPEMPPFDESKFEPMPEVEINPRDEFYVDEAKLAN